MRGSTDPKGMSYTEKISMPDLQALFRHKSRSALSEAVEKRPSVNQHVGYEPNDRFGVRACRVLRGHGRDDEEARERRK